MKNLKRLFLLLLLAPVVLAFNGCGGEDTVYGDWVKVYSDFPGKARCGSASFVIEKTGYLTCGWSGGSTRYKDGYAFDGESRTWESIAEFPGEARSNAVGFSIGSKGYVGLGYNGSEYLKDFYEYDPATNAWTKIADFPGNARDGAIGFGLNGKGYVGAGFDGNYRNDYYVYDQATGAWGVEKILPGTKRYNGTTFIYKNEAYMIGGMNNGSYVYDFWKFNPGTDTWTALNEIYDSPEESFDDDYNNIGRQFPIVLVIDDVVYLTCGQIGSGSLLTDTWAYDFAVDKWDDAPAFEGYSRTAAVGFSMGDRGFITTGRSGSSMYFDDIWEYFPHKEIVVN